ncbi:MAG: exosortase C-terminal domain/associated protein EpsI [Parahaliea sp.]
MPDQRCTLGIRRSFYDWDQLPLYYEIQQCPARQVVGADAITRFVALNADQEQWQLMDFAIRELPWGEQTLSVNQSTVDNRKQRLVVWYWYRIDGYNTGNPYLAKALELWQLLRGNPQGTQRVMLYAPLTETRSPEESMRRFLLAQKSLLEGEG